jgi:TolB protein
MKAFIALFIILFQLNLHAQDAVIAVGEAEVEKDKLVIDDPEMKSVNSEQKKIASDLMDLLRNNFIFYKHKFNTVDYADKGKSSYSNPNLDKWKENDVAYFISSQISGNFSGIEAQYKVWSVLTGKEIFSDSFKLNENELRAKGHEIADKIYRSITGVPSIFKSKIVFVSDRSTRGKDALKELYIMDFDGRRVERLTNFDSVVLSPAISPDNTKIMFSVITTKKEVSRNKVRSIKNIDLKMLNLKTKEMTTISQKPGINSGAIFSREGDGDIIYLTLSYTGNADIYEMNTSSGKMRKVTSHYADDVDPSITRDGKLMAFLSNRPGRAHIYTMNPTQTEKDVKRISFVGKFNATPRFSPSGKEIVFTSWVDNGFDLYRIGSDGNNLVRLTKDFGSNEEPVYSPDGEFIVFTSKRVISKTKAVQDIYIMNREGEILGQLTQDFGRCFSPQWTNLLE